MPPTPTSLYGLQKQRNLANGKEISSSTTLSFTSQLSSLIDSSSSSTTPSSTSRPRPRPSSNSTSKKSDIFQRPNRGSAKRAKRDLDPDHAAVVQQQVHSTRSEPLDASLWERSRRKMQEKARLYAAMQRGDLEDQDERYQVDFDQKWADRKDKPHDSGPSSDDDDEDNELNAHPNSTAPEDLVTYIDEFGRTRTGTQLDAQIAAHQATLSTSSTHHPTPTDRFSARPLPPSTLLHGDTIQYHATSLTDSQTAAIAALAAKRDKSLTPPPAEHFDTTREIRNKGTGFFRFSRDEQERERQMRNLTSEREQTEKARAERQKVLDQRRREVDARKQEILRRSAKRKADVFLQEMGLGKSGGGGEGEGSVQPQSDADFKDADTQGAEDEELEKPAVDTHTPLTSRIAAVIAAEEAAD